MREIVVVGGGFAGFHTVKALERGLVGRRRVRLTLVSDRAHFLFTPLLPNVAHGELNLHSVTLPLREHLEDTTRFILDEVRGVDLKESRLYLSSQTLPFDYLVLAPGAQTNWMGHEPWRPFAMTCKDAHDATTIREALEAAYREAAHTHDAQQRQALLTFVFAGAGPTGVELAAELRAAVRQRVFPRVDEPLRRATRFVLIEPQHDVLPTQASPLRAAARRHLEAQGVELRLGSSVLSRDALRVELDDGDALHAKHFFWCAGVKAHELVSGLDGVTIGPRGRALVNACLQPEGGPEHVFILGDSALSPLDEPQAAQSATQQAPVAAYNLLAVMSGRTPKPWQLEHQGELITLGRGQAAAMVKGVALEGVPAYALYRAVYASLMPDPLKKLRVLRDWFATDLRTLRQDQPSLAQRLLSD